MHDGSCSVGPGQRSRRARETTHQALRKGGLVAGAGVALGGNDKMNPAVMLPNHDMERTTANRAHPVPAVR